MKMVPFFGMRKVGLHHASQHAGLVKLGVEALQFDFPHGFNKGFANRVVMAFAADFLQSTQVQPLKAVAAVAWAAHQFGRVCDKGGLFFTNEEGQQAAQLGITYVQTHIYLARKALRDGRPRWKVRPRLHSFLCEVALKLHAGSCVNPKYTACWAEESFVGKVCNIGKATAVHPATLALRLLQRLQLELNVYLTKSPPAEEQKRRYVRQP